MLVKEVNLYKFSNFKVKKVRVHTQLNNSRSIFLVIQRYLQTKKQWSNLAYSVKVGLTNPIKDTKAKKFSAERAFPNMTVEIIEERDTIGEIKGWPEKINKLMN
jgi:hypothetical protein